MKYVPIFLALMVGVALGAYFSRPPKVKASSLLHVQRVNGSMVDTPYDTYLGFSCTAQDCYVISR